jgi:hypothetical protein
MASTSRKRAHPNDEPFTSNKRVRTKEKLRATEAQCQTQLKEIDDLIHENEEYRRTSYQDHAKDKQDMMLDMVMERERSSDRIETLRRRLSASERNGEAHRVSSAAAVEEAAAQKREVEDKMEQIRILQLRVTNLEKKYKEMEMKTLRLTWEQTAWRNEIDELLAEKDALQGDLDQLREIEVEDAARRQRKAQGLPPAYGSLDNEDEMPPWQQHSDSGAFAIANVKRIVRNKFVKALRDACVENDAHRAKGDKTLEDTNAQLFFKGSLALADACRALRTTLDHADLAFELQGQQYCKSSSSIAKGKLEQILTITHQPARRDYIASRVAKLVLDLHWRIASAIELRPSTIKLWDVQKAKAAIAFAEIDETMLEALRITFHGAGDSTNNRRLVEYDLQYWHSLIMSARCIFDSGGSPMNYKPFDKTHRWLSSQTEEERCRAANAGAVHETRESPVAGSSEARR